MADVGVREVADRAGVSISTVSNALNKPERVAPDTLARVLSAMSSLGYVPNQLARQLRTGSTRSIGLVVLNIENPFFAALAHACEVEAEKYGFTVVMGSSDQSVEREGRYLDHFEAQRMVGTLVASSSRSTARLRQSVERGHRVVLFDIGDPDFDTVSIDEEAGGFLAVGHLIEQGRRRIAFVGGPPDQAKERLSGAMRACASHRGVELIQISTTDQTIEEGSRAAVQLLADGEIDGVFAANDLLAIGVMQAVIAQGRTVPGDVAIVGFDDIAYASTAIVPLTTIRQPVAQLASSALDLLLGDERNEPRTRPPSNVLLAPTLTVRRSSLRAR